MTALIYTQDERREWLLRRRRGIGASDVASVVGLAPPQWGSRWSLWAEKVGLLPLDESDNDAAKFGRYAERMVEPWFRDETGLTVVAEQAEVEHPDDPIALATLDGLVFDAPVADWSTTSGQIKGYRMVDGFTPVDVELVGTNYYKVEPLGVLEIKAPRPFETWADGVPPHYQCQGQWQCYVTGLPRVWFAVLRWPRLEIVEVERDQDDIDFLVAEVHRFWGDHVLTGEPPAVDGSQATLDALAAAYPTHTPGSAVDVSDLSDVIGLWQAAKADVRDAEERVNEWAAHIKAALGENEEGLIDGQRVVSWRQSDRAGYTVAPSSVRTLRHHKPKKSKGASA